MVDEAAKNEGEDKKRREEIETKNKAESVCYQLERQLKDNKDKIEPATATAIEEQIAKVRKALEGGDVDTIKKEEEALIQLSHKMAEAMYKNAGGPEGGATPPSGDDAKGGKKDPGVVDAEFEEAP
jgi:molecular chaperone DnaK